jgi:hypothetical protein
MLQWCQHIRAPLPSDSLVTRWTNQNASSTGGWNWSLTGSNLFSECFVIDERRAETMAIPIEEQCSKLSTSRVSLEECRVRRLVSLRIVLVAEEQQRDLARGKVRALPGLSLP